MNKKHFSVIACILCLTLVFVSCEMFTIPNDGDKPVPNSWREIESANLIKGNWISVYSVKENLTESTHIDVWTFYNFGAVGRLGIKDGKIDFSTITSLSDFDSEFIKSNSKLFINQYDSEIKWELTIPMSWEDYHNSFPEFKGDVSVSYAKGGVTMTSRFYNIEKKPVFDSTQDTWTPVTSLDGTWILTYMVTENSKVSTHIDVWTFDTTEVSRIEIGNGTTKINTSSKEAFKQKFIKPGSALFVNETNAEMKWELTIPMTFEEYKQLFPDFNGDVRATYSNGVVTMTSVFHKQFFSEK